MTTTSPTRTIVIQVYVAVASRILALTRLWLWRTPITSVGHFSVAKLVIRIHQTFVNDFLSFLEREA